MKGKLVIGKLVAKMLMKIPILSGRSDFSPAVGDDHDAKNKSAQDTLPRDVKEGHFVVHTIDDGELKRFILELNYLTHPGFLQLLEQAEEEYGFSQDGVLVIPCRHCDLERILEGVES